MRGFVRSLFGQVVAALVLGILLGWLYPRFAITLQPLGDGFIRLIKMAIAPLVFGVVVHGIVGAGDLRKVGRVGVKAILYLRRSRQWRSRSAWCSPTPSNPASG